VERSTVPLTKRLRPAESDYWPHTTVVLDMKPEEAPLAEDGLIQLDLSGEMKFESIELIGRVGPSRGGEYQILGSYPLSG